MERERPDGSVRFSRLLIEIRNSNSPINDFHVCWSTLPVTLIIDGTADSMFLVVTWLPGHEAQAKWPPEHIDCDRRKICRVGCCSTDKIYVVVSSNQV